MFQLNLEEITVEDDRVDKEKRVDERDRVEKYKSVGERFIAGILDDYNVNFTYEDRMVIETKYKNEKFEKKRLVYPDFHIVDLGIVIEYIGMTGNSNYDKVHEMKQEGYKKAGAKVINIYKDDVFDENYRRRGDFEKTLLEKIDSMINEEGDAELDQDSIDSKVFSNYDFWTGHYN